MKWETDFFEWYGDYTEMRFNNKEEALKKIQHLLNENVDLKIEFRVNEVLVYMDKSNLKKYRRFLFNIEKVE